MSCYYCNDEYNHFHYENEENESGYAEITITNGSDGEFYLEVISDNLYRQIIKPINYCPMCGRKV